MIRRSLGMLALVACNRTQAIATTDATAPIVPSIVDAAMPSVEAGSAAPTATATGRTDIGTSAGPTCVVRFERIVTATDPASPLASKSVSSLREHQIVDYNPTLDVTFLTGEPGWPTGTFSVTTTGFDGHTLEIYDVHGQPISSADLVNRQVYRVFGYLGKGPHSALAVDAAVDLLGDALAKALWRGTATGTATYAGSETKNRTVLQKYVVDFDLSMATDHASVHGTVHLLAEHQFDAMAPLVAADVSGPMTRTLSDAGTIAGDLRIHVDRTCADSP